MRRRHVIALLLIATVSVLLAACPGQTTSLRVTPTTATVEAGGANVSFSAALAGATDTINWTLSGPGSIAPASGTSTTYTPPATVASTQTATLTATAGPLTATATITINPPAVPTPALTVSPTSSTVDAGGDTQVFTATLTNSTDAIDWSLAGPGSIAPASGTSTTYTPPATVASTQTATLTATAGTLSASATITITVPATITVNGIVRRFDGQPVNGVEVRIIDANDVVIASTGDGVGQFANTGADGTFTLSGVTVPYRLSVIPATSGLGLPQTWAGVTRADPTLVITPLGGSSGLCPTPAPAALTVNLNQPVATNHTGRIYFLGEGISNLEILSSAQSTAMAAGDSSRTFNVPFDTALCQTTIAGRVVYIERNDSGGITRIGTTTITVVTGNPATAPVTVNVTTTQSISGTVVFPAGTVSGTVYMIMSFGDAALLLPAANVTTAAPNYDIAAATIAGIEYRTLAFVGSFAGTQVQWAYSDLLSPGDSGVTLSVPSLGQSITPTGGGNTSTPTFTFTQVTGTNLNFAYAVDAATTGNVNRWLGASTETSIALPVLPSPANLPAGTSTTPNNYAWFPLNSVNVRGGGGTDAMLDGRQVKKLHFGFEAIFNPSVVGAGSYNFETTTFTVP